MGTVLFSGCKSMNVTYLHGIRQTDSYEPSLAGEILISLQTFWSILPSIEKSHGQQIEEHIYLWNQSLSLKSWKAQGLIAADISGLEW